MKLPRKGFQMRDIIRMVLGLQRKRDTKDIERYKIKPTMIKPNVVVMDMNSFKQCETVKKQFEKGKI